MKDLFLTEKAAAAREYREKLLNDPYRPRYHFAVPDGDGRPGDPNGCFYADGTHHLMYLYRRGNGAFHWGHVTSRDLLHWRHYADSLAKGPQDEGCFSGGAFVDDDGTAYLSYWIFNDGGNTDGRNAGIGLAKSAPPYEKWERMKGAAIGSSRWGIRDEMDVNGDVVRVGCADPSNIWKQNGRYYMQLGNLCVLNEYGREPDSPATARGDWTELFSSSDMLEWEYMGRFYRRRADNAWTDETEDDMCPSYLPLPLSPDGGAVSGKMLQLFISHNKGCQYYIGRQEGERFIPESHGRMSWKDNAFFAPEAYLDGRGRQIMFAWLLDNLNEDYGTYGWSGVFCLPRTLWLRRDNTLGIAPAKETDALRYNEREYSGGETEIPVQTPDCCEINAVFDGAGAYRAGFIVDSGESHKVTVMYDSREGSLSMDLTESGSPVRAIREEAPLALGPGENLDMRLFVDRSVLEIFVNDRQAISRRVYFPKPDNLRIKTIREGDVAVSGLRSWQMAPTNPY